ncbi:MAG: terminase small subunit [Terriglobales bacterium]
MPRVRRDADGLTDRERRFAELYVLDLDKAKAYVGAGFRARSQHVAESGGLRLLTTAPVSSLVEKLKAQLCEKVGLDAARTIDEHACIAHVCSEDIWNYDGDKWTLKAPKDVPKRARRAIKSVKIKTTTKRNGEVVQETEVALFDKLTALTTELKMEGKLSEKHEHSGPNGGPIPVTVIRLNLHVNASIPGNTGGAGSGDQGGPMPAALESGTRP